MSRSRLLTCGETVSRFAIWIGGLMIVLTSVLICVEVILRKVANISTGGADELSGYALAIGSSWAMAFTLLQRAHVRVDAIYVQLNRSARTWLDCLAIICMASFAIALTYFCFGVLRESIALSARSTTTLSIPLWIPQGLWLTGLVIFSAISLMLAGHAIWALLRGDPDTVQALVGSRTADEEIKDEIGNHHNGPDRPGGGMVC
ncbi:MAG: TRAP transporter small permease subunit [Pseudorhodobacter sp.]